MNAFNLSLSSCTQCNVLWFYCMRVEKRRERGKLKQIIVFAVETSKRSDMKLNEQKKAPPRRPNKVGIRMDGRNHLIYK